MGSMKELDSTEYRATPGSGGTRVAHDETTQVSRRALFKTAGAGVAVAALGVTTVANAQTQSWNEEADIVVVGSGAAALAAAVAAQQNGVKVVMYEKGPVPGGTTAKSGGAHWIPNNYFQQAEGIRDSKDDAVRYMARVAYPHLYRADHPTLGLAPGRHELITTFYDHGSRVVKALAAAGAMRIMMMQGLTGPLPDYQGQLPENNHALGRTLCPVDPDGRPGFGGDMIRQFSTFLEARGVKIQVESRVTRIVKDEVGRVIGVEIETPDGRRTARARKGVIFGSGGFTHNPEMRTSYLRIPVLGGCAAATNEGDFVTMAIELGAKLGNMNEAWLQQEALEEVLRFPSVPFGAFLLGGDSMIVVNKFGNRMYNEKHVYNERTRSHAVWDAMRAEYVNIYQFMLFDDHAIETGGQLMPTPGSKMPDYIISAPTWESLATAIQQRLASLSDRIGAFKLEPGFLPALRAAIERFNGFAETGNDLDFGRGTLPIEHAFHAPGPHNDKPNKAMYPFAAKGPYHCIILAGGTLDTKGGPVINVRAEVLDVYDRPIPGLYAAGNCAASPAGQAYWGAGGTIGPALTYGYIAGEQASRQP
jgi:succinate dehydrogenase/fumarate reductase flavoprotein subunit